VYPPPPPKEKIKVKQYPSTVIAVQTLNHSDPDLAKNVTVNLNKNPHLNTDTQSMALGHAQGF
jgi:hypothetical protein